MTHPSPTSPFRLAATGLAVASAIAMASLAPSIAHAKFVFPYNHPDLQWYTIETEHFEVHYPKSRKPREKAKHYVNAEFSARKTAKVAEEMWGPMCEQFDYYLTEKVHIVVLDQSDRLEGFTIPAWDWIEVSANPGAYFYRMRGRMEWFSDVLVHEFAHVVSLKKNQSSSEHIRGISVGVLYTDGVHDTETGAEVFIGDSNPFWWTEGGAEYWSDNSGYNWWTAAREMNLRTTVLEDRLLTFDEWMTRSQSFDWGDGERGYQQGYSIALYLRQRFGERVFNDFANETDKKQRVPWERVIERVTGVSAKQLYVDWKAYLEEYYAGVAEGVRAEGEVTGRELELSFGGWENWDPAARDKWYTEKKGFWRKEYRSRKDREGQRGRSGTWEYFPRMSDDGAWLAESSSGTLKVRPQPEHLLSARSGDAPNAAENAGDARRMSDMTGRYPVEFSQSYDFVPGKNQIVVTTSEDAEKNFPVLEPEVDGYDWKELFLLDLEGKTKKRKHGDGKESYPTLEHRKPWGIDKNPGRVIPNTKRGQEPAVRPDGERLAFLEYDDGTLNVATINLDGSDKKYLTTFHDGTWMQGIDWSPDGSQIIVSVFRNYRQDLLVMDADGSNAHYLWRDGHEDQDAHWAQDGSIYFSSDAGGIFNIFRFDPATRRIHQITNVIGGAEMPWVTPSGDLMYVNFTAFGWKSYILARDEFLDKDVTAEFGLDFDHEQATAELAWQEDLSEFEALTKRYSFLTDVMHPTIVPVLRFQNEGQGGGFGLDAGLQVFWQDMAEKYTAFGLMQLGTSPLFGGGLTYQGWVPNIGFFGYHLESKFDYGFRIDDDNDPTTTDDQTVWESKQVQYVNLVRVDIDYPWNEHVTVGLGGAAIEYGFKGITDSAFTPFLRSFDVTFSLGFAPSWIQYVSSSINPRGFMRFDLDLGHGYTDVVYKPYGGVDTDDGEALDAYQFNRAELRWSGYLQVPTFGLKALEFVKDHRHTLQLDVVAGMIDRNVQQQDEFRGGGRHPYFYGPGSVEPNQQFAGYPNYSLSGETMLIVSAAYRFPIVQRLNKHIGPLYLKETFLQIGGTVGNFWSYRPPEESDTDCYYNDDFGSRVVYPDRPDCSISREIPFVDYSYKNSRLTTDSDGRLRGRNFLLGDAVIELRSSAVLLNVPFDNFIRVAWAFNRISGVSDVNGDDISETIDTGLGDALSSEWENPGPRIFIGIGTGW